MGHGETSKGWALIAPPALYALALLALPLGAVVVLSFFTQDFLTLDTTPTLENYRIVLTDPGFAGQLPRTLLVRSVTIAGLVTVCTVLLAYPVAYYVSFHVAPERKSLWLFLITIPFWTSYLVRVFLWKVILNFDGVVNRTLLNLGWIDEPIRAFLYSPAAVVITLTHAFAPFAILPIFVALEKIDRPLLEASRDLGEGTLRTFARVTLPLSMPGVVAAVLIVFIPTIGDYVTPRLVGGPDGLMIANLIQSQFGRLSNAPMGATLAVIAMASVGLISLLFVLATRRWTR
ncbi:spermidine/putrescine transport system permease protein [Hasllibacter halocynthiae]|uniref:Spermidine/putrescine transport system permease protein n=1 Tax=Hasllibacter halocynthiae TaxID=595589 RepID=A0A2T0X8D7_9RHOB|nr:ABC transporter permease [Hasllibacter halocynthiae]PRY95193.1 spermidine/putrescine transport system permease protein [Hasllibacter halocynthiae]